MGADEKKNIWFWMRNTSYYVDLYLRHVVSQIEQLRYGHRAETDREFKMLGLNCNFSLFYKNKWIENYAVSKDGFFLIVKAELERGSYLDKIQHDFKKLKEFIEVYKQFLINRLLEDKLSDERINELIVYLIKTVSMAQKGGRRGIVKTRPVVFERIFSYFQNKDYISFEPKDILSPAGFKYRLGAILEMYNRATYAIDDVMDGSDFRGGLPTLHRVANDRQAIIVGQYLHLLSIEMMLSELEDIPISQSNKIKALDSLNIIHKSIYAGEIDNFKLQHRIVTNKAFRLKRLKMPLASLKSYYLKRVDLRTGKFYEYIAKIAVLTATGDNRLAERFKRYGLALGMRYLIDNDLKDLIDPYFVMHGTPSRGLKGKEHLSFCGDIEIGKITFPVFVALKKKFDPDIIEMIGRKLSYEEKVSITKFVVENNGVEKTMELMESIMKGANKVLSDLKIRDRSLIEFVDLYQYSDIPFKKFIEYIHEEEANH